MKKFFLMLLLLEVSPGLGWEAVAEVKAAQEKNLKKVENIHQDKFSAYIYPLDPSFGVNLWGSMHSFFPNSTIADQNETHRTNSSYNGGNITSFFQNATGVKSGTMLECFGGFGDLASYVMPASVVALGLVGGAWGLWHVAKFMGWGAKTWANLEKKNSNMLSEEERAQNDLFQKIAQDISHIMDFKIQMTNHKITSAHSFESNILYDKLDDFYIYNDDSLKLRTDILLDKHANSSPTKRSNITSWMLGPQEIPKLSQKHRMKKIFSALYDLEKTMFLLKDGEGLGGYYHELKKLLEESTRKMAGGFSEDQADPADVLMNLLPEVEQSIEVFLEKSQAVKHHLRARAQVCRQDQEESMEALVALKDPMSTVKNLGDLRAFLKSLEASASKNSTLDPLFCDNFSYLRAYEGNRISVSQILEKIGEKGDEIEFYLKENIIDLKNEVKIQKYIYTDFKERIIALEHDFLRQSPFGYVPLDE